ncbi:hypothetical protein NDU88_002312 [Pleurodeles waltl]|uniref:Uncharacterized protein n=1 Tax=Pleurodeles waltl TaxID=8319 RepID=A0AAV7LC04_PLEWA|nr:hypothetical protein NDU88_002312 [Pleurodeles waltl]
MQELQLRILDAAGVQEGPGCRTLEEETEGALSNSESPPQKQVAPAEVPEQALRRSEDSGRLRVTKEGPTKSESNSASWAMQNGVLGTQARLCTKKSLEKCTEAREAADHAVHRITVWRGEARTYLHQIWTEGPLDCGRHLDPAPVFQGPHSSG